MGEEMVAAKRGSHTHIFKELSVENKLDFQNYIRLPVELFDSLLKKITPLIQKEDTVMRASISPGARLEATLLFLSSGCSYTYLQYSTRISKSVQSTIIIETCEAIYTV